MKNEEQEQLDSEVLHLAKPTSVFDPSSTSKIEEPMVELKQQYMMVPVTHNMQQVARVANDMTSSTRGSWGNSAKAPDILENPWQELTQRYIGGRLV